MRKRFAAGQRFGRLQTLRKAAGEKYPSWVCRCDCGSEVVIISSNLPRTYSCGCYRRECGKSLTQTYRDRWTIHKVKCNGQLMPVAQAAAILGIKRNTIDWRLQRGDDPLTVCDHL